MKIEYQQLLFLYAYLRQIDLSLDRSRWTSWHKLRDYYLKWPRPIQVIEYLERNFRLPNNDFEQFIFTPEKNTFKKKIKSAVWKNEVLNENEIMYYCKLLWNFDKELNSETKKYNSGIEELRIEVAKYYTEILKSLISNKDLVKLMRVEHFGQNENVEVIELSEFMPNEFNID